MTQIGARDAECQLYRCGAELMSQSSFEEALACFGQAADIFRARGQRESWVAALCMMSQCFLRLGRLVEAQDAIEWAVQEANLVSSASLRMEAYQLLRTVLQEISKFSDNGCDTQLHSNMLDQRAHLNRNLRF
jgi:tetratricopeptide (TPR) repeat protein